MYVQSHHTALLDTPRAGLNVELQAWRDFGEIACRAERETKEAGVASLGPGASVLARRAAGTPYESAVYATDDSEVEETTATDAAAAASTTHAAKRKRGISSAEYRERVAAAAEMEVAEISRARAAVERSAAVLERYTDLLDKYTSQAQEKS